MSARVATAFEPRGLTVPIDRVLPLKQIPTDPSKNATLRRVMASIREVGIIEPLIVYRRGKGKDTRYSLLDGHVRLEAAKQLGQRRVPCLISTEDEAYTYNHKVNAVPPIQEHFMIMKAIESGVSEDRIAAALDVDVASIRRKRDLLSGICPEAVQLLKDKHPSQEALREFRKVRPMRQIEMAELMIAAHNFTASYAKCLLAVTPEDQLLDPERRKTGKGPRPDEIARMERETESLEQDFRALKESHGKNVLHFMLSTAYLRRLLDNAAVVRYLSARQPDVLAEFQKTVELTSLDRGG